MGTNCRIKNRRDQRMKTDIQHVRQLEKELQRLRIAVEELIVQQYVSFVKFAGQVVVTETATIEIAMFHKYTSSAYIGSEIQCLFTVILFQYSDARALDVWVNGNLAQSYSSMTDIGFPGYVWVSNTFYLDDGDTLRCRIKTAIFQNPYVSLNLNLGPITAYP